MNKFLSKKHHGFTLLELILVIAVAAILVVIASPSFSRQIQRSEVRQVASDFQATLEDAKRKAYVSGRSFTVCPVNDVIINNPVCLNDWSKFNGTDTTSPNKGWIVFHDANSDNKVDGDENIVAKNAPPGKSSAMEWNGSSSVITLTPRNTIGSSGTMRVYSHKRGILPSWSSTNPPNVEEKLLEMRIKLSPLGTVKFYNK